MINFQRTYSADGWRHAEGYRTRPWNPGGDSRIIWQVERWDGENWVRIGDGDSYEDALRITGKS